MSFASATSDAPPGDVTSVGAGLDADPRRVLVVDDDVLGARALARLLRDDGYEVEVVTDGAAAVARLSAQPLPDVVVTEVTLPHASGLALARYARAQHAGMVIVFATSSPERARDAALIPRPKVVAKPLDYASLRDALPSPAR
jgi:CheY-like chemotaxis protein